MCLCSSPPSLFFLHLSSFIIIQEVLVEVGFLNTPKKPFHSIHGVFEFI
jgi:hypothetical protein